jgi:hypothetical protein
MHLVHGRLSIESKPGKGTKILAVVPLSEHMDSTSNGTGTETGSLARIA